MSCDSCTQIKALNACGTFITLGVSTLFSTAIKVYAENLATGKQTVFDTTTSGTGRITLEHSFAWLPNVTYKFWVTEATAGSPDVYHTITLLDGTTSASCMTVMMESIYDNTGAKVSTSDQTFVKA